MEKNKEQSTEEFVKEMGFESEREFNYLISNADLSTPERLKSFEEWKRNDGTKSGLLKVNQQNGK